MKFKQKYKIGKALSLVGLMILANACHKEPYDVIIDYTWGPIPTPKEVIQKEINKKDVNMVFLNCGEKNLTNWSPADFHCARDTLQTRLDIAPGRIRGMGTIYVNSAHGAHLSDVNEHLVAGMALEDSIWYTANGWKVQRLHPEWAK